MPRTALVIGSNPTTRGAIKKALRERLQIEAVAESGSAAEAVPSVAALDPDFTVVAQRLADPAEVLALRDIRDLAPRGKVVVLTWYAAESDWLAALLAGASACLLVEVRMMDTLAGTLERIAAGENLIDAEHGEQLARLTAPFMAGATAVGQEVLSRVFRLQTNSEIVQELGVPPEVVRKQVLEVASRFLTS